MKFEGKTVEKVFEVFNVPVKLKGDSVTNGRIVVLSVLYKISATGRRVGRRGS
jgi:hypothetical protein